MSKYRILEVVDGNNQSVFIPQFKGIFGIWFGYPREVGNVEFSNKEAALHFINQQKPKKEVIHDVN